MAQDRLDKLIAKREAMNAKIRLEQGRERSRRRRHDTRRKIIAGALVLAEEDPAIKGWLYGTLGQVLTRKDERDLFGLPALSSENPTLMSSEPDPAAARPELRSAWMKRRGAARLEQRNERSGCSEVNGFAATASAGRFQEKLVAVFVRFRGFVFPEASCWRSAPSDLHCRPPDDGGCPPRGGFIEEKKVLIRCSSPIFGFRRIGPVGRPRVAELVGVRSSS